MTQLDPRSNALAAFVRAALAGLLAASLSAIVGCFPMANTAGGAGVQSMLIGLAGALAGAWIGVGVWSLALTKAGPQQIGYVLGGLGARFAATCVIAVVMAFSGLPSPKLIVLWVAIGQLTILLADTWVFSRDLKRCGGRPS